MTMDDKTVLVTGANRGIGQALVAEALARGAKRVYAGTRRPLTHPDDRVTPLSLDVTSPAQIQAAATQVESLDMLINNAGIARPDDLTDPAALERHLAVNLFGTGAVRAFTRDGDVEEGATGHHRSWPYRELSNRQVGPIVHAEDAVTWKALE